MGITQLNIYFYSVVHYVILYYTISLTMKRECIPRVYIHSTARRRKKESLVSEVDDDGLDVGFLFVIF